MGAEAGQPRERSVRRCIFRTANGLVAQGLDIRVPAPVHDQWSEARAREEMTGKEADCEGVTVQPRDADPRL